MAELCPTLRDPMPYDPPGSSVHGISQARILEWVAVTLSSYISLIPTLWNTVFHVQIFIHIIYALWIVSLSYTNALLFSLWNKFSFICYEDPDLWFHLICFCLAFLCPSFYFQCLKFFVLVLSLSYSVELDFILDDKIWKYLSFNKWVISLLHFGIVGYIWS